MIYLATAKLKPKYRTTFRRRFVPVSLFTCRCIWIENRKLCIIISSYTLSTTHLVAERHWLIITRDFTYIIIIDMYYVYDALRLIVIDYRIKYRPYSGGVRREKLSCEMVDNILTTNYTIGYLRYPLRWEKVVLISPALQI